jgi:mRNA interferase RelE/StbE
MAYRYEFLQAAAKDLLKLTRHDAPLLVAIVTEHLPAILRDPLKAGEPKRGDLAGVSAYNLTHRGVAYRLVYAIEEDVVVVVAIGPHDAAYARAKRR